MKVGILLFFCIIMISVSKADDDKYTAAMKKNIAALDTASGLASWVETGNNFERIALAEKDKWLPYYYAAYVNIIANYIDQDNTKKDTYLDKSDALIKVADSLKPKNSEIYTLKGMLAQARMAVDPMNRYQQYGNESYDNFDQAMQIDSLNPRPYYLIGTGLFYTPEQFGGGGQAAKPYLEKAYAKFETFVPENELMPTWGKNITKQMLDQIK